MECGASSSFLRYLRTSGKKRGSRVQRWGRSTRAHSGLVVVAPGMSAADGACESWVLRPQRDLVPEGCGLRAETRRAAAGQAGDVIQMTGALATPALPIAWRSSRLAEKAMASSGVSVGDGDFVGEIDTSVDCVSGYAHTFSRGVETVVHLAPRGVVSDVV